MPREDFRLKPPQGLRVRTRSRGGGVGLRLCARGGRSRSGYGLGLRLAAGGGRNSRRAHGLPLFCARRIDYRGVVLSFLLGRRSWSNGFGFLFARSEKRGAGQNAD